MTSFQTTVELHGKTATGFEVPAAVVEALGAGRRPAVTVGIAGYTYRSSVAARGDRFLVPLSAEHRAGAGVAAGDVIEVTLTLDTAPRTVEVPPDLAAALDGDPAARAHYDSLSFSQQRGFVEPVGQAKTPETRARRIAKVVEAMQAGRTR